MDLFSIKTIKSIFQTQGTRPRKGLGQNFLISRGVLGHILKAGELSKTDTVLEIGPGVGTLTRELAQSAKKVIAVEKDPAMVEILRETTKDLPNIDIIKGDALKLSLIKELLNQTKFRYRVVANLPYYITSPVIRLFLEAKNRPDLLVLMVQKEVAQRICAKPPHMSLLAVSVQIYGKPSIVSYVKRGCFWPQPKVDSAILKITPNKQNLVRLSFPQLKGKLNRTKFSKFFCIVKAGFKQPRKQLANNLVRGLSMKRDDVEKWLRKNHINSTQRAETLSVEDWIKLAKDYTIYE